MKYAELVESPECRSWGGASGRGSRCAGSRAPGGGRSAPSTQAPRRSPGHTPATQTTVGPKMQPCYALFKTFFKSLK